MVGGPKRTLRVLLYNTCLCRDPRLFSNTVGLSVWYHSLRARDTILPTPGGSILEFLFFSFKFFAGGDPLCALPFFSIVGGPANTN